MAQINLNEKFKDKGIRNTLIIVVFIIVAAILCLAFTGKIETIWGVSFKNNSTMKEIKTPVKIDSIVKKNDTVNKLVSNPSRKRQENKKDQAKSTDINNSTFNGPTQVGDNNTMNVGK